MREIKFYEFTTYDYIKRNVVTSLIFLTIVIIIYGLSRILYASDIDDLMVFTIDYAMVYMILPTYCIVITLFMKVNRNLLKTVLLNLGMILANIAVAIWLYYIVRMALGSIVYLGLSIGGSGAVLITKYIWIMRKTLAKNNLNIKEEKGKM